MTSEDKPTDEKRVLRLNFHGRVIDHLGIQMYQSPTAAIAEIISNCWDADAELVDIHLRFDNPHKLEWEIIVEDNGNGMTFEQCQTRFLTVGFDKRGDQPTRCSEQKNRPPMGRKGIGKFAGFGIASQIEIDTTSSETGERTRFLLDLETIRGGDTYVSTNDLNIDPIEYEGPNESRKSNKGTIITLKKLSVARRIPLDQFRRSMARRFLVNLYSQDFTIKVDDEQLPEDEDMSTVELSYPKDYRDDERPDTLTSIDPNNGWGSETLRNGKEIKWRVLFFKETIKDDELKGIAVFAHGKIAQRPFMFNLSGGLTTQTGPEYMAGAVVADYVDELSQDVISTERQRLNWEHEELVVLQDWGQQRIKSLLGLWKGRRVAKNMKMLEEKIGAFKERIENLGKEGKAVVGALKKLASIEKLSEVQFREVGNAVLTAWEGGRLRELIREVAHADEMDESKLLSILVEANAIQALHTAEGVRSKLDAIIGLEKRITNRELENAVRNYIAKHPWMISPKWETFAVENSVKHVVTQAADQHLKKYDGYNGRIDLVLGSGQQLLLLEFMRPGLKVDINHINRYELYVREVQSAIDQSTALNFKIVTGYLVADNVDKAGGAVKSKLKSLATEEMYVMTWLDLLAVAKSQWKEFLDHIVQRAPDDNRLVSVATASYQEDINPGDEITRTSSSLSES